MKELQDIINQSAFEPIDEFSIYRTETKLKRVLDSKRCKYDIEYDERNRSFKVTTYQRPRVENIILNMKIK